MLLPVGGPIYEGALTAIADSGADAVMIGTDADVFESDPRTQEVILTSVLKGMDISTKEVARGRRRQLRRRAVHRHARERRRRHRPVPQLRG